MGKNTGQGFGLVEEAYSYLMELYKMDNRIFLFEFCRGAYTARSLGSAWGIKHLAESDDSGHQ